MAHRLSPMFEAQSMVVVGASARAGSFGARLATASLSGGFKGHISFVNPRGGEILGREALPSIRDLDHAPDVAVLGVGGANLERALVDAVERGARSAVIFDSCHGETEDGKPILERLRTIAKESRIPVCGGSGMGFINTRTGSVASFYPADHLKPGGISLIAHSGSVFTVLGMNDPRYRFDLMVSPGQEIGASIEGGALPKSYRQRNRDQLRQVQMIYQMADTALNPKLKIGELIGRPAQTYLDLKGKALTERVRELLALIGLEPNKFVNRRPSELSGGQKQRIGIARALAAEPKIIICDEVTSALDQIVAEGILKLLDRLQSELDLTYMFITHDMATVRAIADDVVIMRAGRLIESGLKECVLGLPETDYTAALLASVPDRDPDWLTKLRRSREAGVM